MTEQEAKTKWCPFARERPAQGMPDGGGNRTPYGSPEDGPVADDYTREQAMLFPCIGSACMAWRQDKEATAARMKELAPESSVAINGHFFCGLAGKP